MKKKEVSPNLSVRPARTSDIRTIATLIRGLAKYEGLARQVKVTPARIRRHGFGPRPYFKTLICQDDSKAVGFATYFFTYSTFLARPTLYIEDLFVLPQLRGKGAGKMLLAALAKISLSAENADAWNGRCLTGISRPSNFTCASAPPCARSGFSHALQALRSGVWRKAASNRHSDFTFPDEVAPQSVPVSHRITVK